MNHADRARDLIAEAWRSPPGMGLPPVALRALYFAEAQVHATLALNETIERMITNAPR